MSLSERCQGAHEYDAEFEEWVSCEDCGGEGVNGHDCGEDCCPCLYPEENMPCQTCDGKGGWTPAPLKQDAATRENAQ